MCPDSKRFLVVRVYKQGTCSRLINPTSMIVDSVPKLGKTQILPFTTPMCMLIDLGCHEEISQLGS